MTLLTHHLIPHVLVCTSSTLQVRFAPLPGSATGNCHVNRAISKLKSHTCSSLIGFSGKKQSLKLISNAWIVCLAKFHRICLNCKVWNCLNILQICLLSLLYFKSVYFIIFLFPKRCLQVKSHTHVSFYLYAKQDKQVNCSNTSWGSVYPRSSKCSTLLVTPGFSFRNLQNTDKKIFSNRLV